MSNRPIFVQIARLNDLGQIISSVTWYNPKLKEFKRELTYANNFNQLKLLISNRYIHYNQPIEYYIGDEDIAFMRFKKRGLI